MARNGRSIGIRTGMGMESSLIKGGFSGTVYPINLKHDTILGLKACASIDRVGSTDNLAFMGDLTVGPPAVMHERWRRRTEGIDRYPGPNCMGDPAPV